MSAATVCRDLEHLAEALAVGSIPRDTWQTLDPTAADDLHKALAEALCGAVYVGANIELHPTPPELERLHAHAQRSGDRSYEAMCKAALAGNTHALRRCGVLLRSARARLVKR